jgi:hypothetical protein
LRSTRACRARQAHSSSPRPRFRYAAILGDHKILLGGGGLPNTWYHDGLPYDGPEPTPQGGCLTACNATGCLAPPMVQVYDVVADPAERLNLAGGNATLLASLLALVDRYNSSTYVEPLFFTHPVETDCPFKDAHGVLTPCDIP